MATTTQFPAATELDPLCVDTIRMLSIDAVEQLDHHMFCIASDGDMQEGISSEACPLAGRRSARRARERVRAK